MAAWALFWVSLGLKQALQPADWPDIPIIVTPNWDQICSLPDFLQHFPFSDEQDTNYVSMNVLMDSPHLQCCMALWDSQLLVL